MVIPAIDIILWNFISFYYHINQRFSRKTNSLSNDWSLFETSIFIMQIDDAHFKGARHTEVIL